jgi:salicylate hydroxylase
MGSKSPTTQAQNQTQIQPPKEQEQEKQIRIAIIGAGIAGLSLAAALLTKNPKQFKIQIYESVPHHHDKGAGLALHANALSAMSLLGPSIRRAYLDAAVSMTSPTQKEQEQEEMATQVILAHGPHAGELVAELGRARGRKSVSRADLLGGFLRLLVDSDCDCDYGSGSESESKSGSVVLFGRRLVGVSERDDGNDDAKGTTGREKRRVIKLEFQNGETAETDCLVGADGIHSVVRAYLLGRDHPATKPKNHDRWQVYRTLVSAEEARAQIGERWTRAVPILLGPRGHVNCIPMNKGTRVSAGVAVRGAAVSGSRGGGGLGVGGDDGDDRHGGSRPLDPSLYSDYTEDAQRIVRMVAKDTSASWSVGDHDHAPYFNRGRVVIIGDAAHASLPFAGNGAAQALEDAAVLDHLFGRVKEVSQIEAALAAFDAVRRPRSQKVVDIARAFGRVYAYAEGNLHEDPQGMRDFFAEAAAFTNEVDLNKQNRDALEIYESILRGDLRHGRAHQEQS